MIDAPSLLDELQKRNIVLAVDAGELKANAPKGAMTPELADTIRANKPALLALLAEPVAPAPVVEPTTMLQPPLHCRKCHTTNPQDFRMNLARNRWVCCNCMELAPLVYSYPPAAKPGPELEQLRREIGELARAEHEQWVYSDELDPRWPPSAKVYTRLYRKEPRQEVTTPGQEQEPERHTDALPEVEPQEQEPEQEHARKPWVTIYADIHTGYAITDTGQAFNFPADCSLSAFVRYALDVTPFNRVFLCGQRPGESGEGFIRWLRDAGMLEDYTTDKRGHYFDVRKPDTSVARYQHRIDKNKIDIRRINSWLGEDTQGQESQEEVRYTIEEARAVLALVTRYIRQYFRSTAHISGTPSSTFKGLWTEANRIAGKHFEPLPEEERTLIHANSGQGRIQFFAENSQGKIPGLFYYDGIFMYAALTWGMPTQVATHDTRNEYAGKVPARYRIRYTVPASWQHVGLFMTRKENGWFYPGVHEAGQTFETWADGAELDIAYNLPQGMPRWDITILERIIYKPESESSETKPLETITRKIVEIRAQIEKDARQDAQRAHLYKLASGAFRNILLHGIGSFNRSQAMRSYILLDSEPAPKGYEDYSEIDEHTRWYKVPETSQDTAMMHPEWPALIWARCRARMTKAALSLPYSELITIRTDAIAVKRPVSAWEANTKVGMLRRKWAYPKPLVAPKDDDQFDALQRKMLGK